MRVHHNKLVRDRIPEIIVSHGGRPLTRILDEHEYRQALTAKLQEEATEAHQATDDQLPGELADVLEVLQTLTQTIGLSWESIVQLAEDKRTQRGGFTNRIYLKYVDQNEK